MLASEDEEALQGGVRHGAGGIVHACGQGLRVAIAAADVGEEEQGMLVESPVASQLVVEAGWQRKDAILVALGVADEQLVVGALDVVDGQAEAFTQAQAAGVDELERGAVATQTDVGEQIVDLLTGEDSREDIVVLGADLGKESPVVVMELMDEEHACGGAGLTDGFWAPQFAQFDVDEVIAQLGFAEGGWILVEMVVDKAHLTIVSVACAIGVVAKCQELGELSHGVVGMLVIDRVDILAPGGADVGEVAVGVMR